MFIYYYYTTLQKLNAIVLKATQSKISQKLGLQRDIAFDLNDIIIDNGHLHQWMYLSALMYYVYVFHIYYFKNNSFI